MLLQIRHLSKDYLSGAARTEVLRDVSFDLDAGETLALEGESGSGKSTVLHLIAGLDSPTSGSILLKGREINGLPDQAAAGMRRSDVGVIFQQFNLIPSLTVGANIAFQARLAGKEDTAFVKELAERIGLADQTEKYPEALSGGQQQRVAIARTLAARPALILADEPTGNLDESTADAVLDLMLESAAGVGAAVLMVTHSARQAARMSRRILLRHGVVQPRLQVPSP
ncbi:ABC transporter ATP-binding protein [Roseobacter ponti]|uniref:ABC transporter ATP-binding protein n=1 Tax=Roseobacter ponti TaxID=1891787 RepID=A0A858SQP1_9RHOB|nr:ABC transporter ATP-binding protein [Roseobacter ponti]QJF51169.1 ABC transporter ATP-binding protein [Roseobacter ponti]